jgi:anti-sigma regulatory factor (Ser/Thr protein kinase)
VRRVLAQAGRDADVAELLTSELAANAVRHGQTPFTVVVSASPVVRVEVHDGNAIVPTVQAARGDDEAGRGLLLIEALADSWGVDECGGGKVVWFELL